MIEVIEKLKQLEGGNFSEVCEKRVFECYRMRSDGCMQEVTVVVLDAGPGAAARYYCHAKSEEGRQVSSRLEPTLDAALVSMRWTDLDPEPAQELQPEGASHGESLPAPEVPARTEYDRRDLFDRFRKRLAGKTARDIDRDS